MTKPIIEIANRFVAEDVCSRQELAQLKSWLSDASAQPEVEEWLAEHWALSPEIDSATVIESLFQQIQTYPKARTKSSGFSLSRMVSIYQRIAAFLLIPLIGFGILYWVVQPGIEVDATIETIAPRGQKSQIVMADGTKVWLNSDTKIRYPGNFGKNQRQVYLDGEAFFEVSKNVRRPFLVHTPQMTVKVLGTKFNVKAYPDEDQVETSLFEGKVNLLWQSPTNEKLVEKEVAPGQSFVYTKTSGELLQNRFPHDEIDGWKTNRLIFRDDTFANLVRKVERWYDVKVVYDEKLFNDRRLTVELYEGERLERLMEIVSLVLSVDYRYERDKIILTPKK